jgi:hypothetical protein
MNEQCVFCGSEVRFRVIRGAVVPLHEGSHACIGNKLYRRGEEDICHPTTCPECGGSVFFVRHNGGCVWLDDLGQPWPKHGCFDVTSAMDIARPAGISRTSYRIAQVTNVMPLADESGFVIFVSCDGEPDLQFRISTDPRQHDLTRLRRKNVFYAKPLRLVRTFSGVEYYISAHIPRFRSNFEPWYFQDFGDDCPLCSKSFAGERAEHMRVCSDYVWLQPFDGDSPADSEKESLQLTFNELGIEVTIRHYIRDGTSRSCFIVGTEQHINDACTWCRTERPPIDVVHHKITTDYQGPPLESF